MKTIYVFIDKNTIVLKDSETEEYKEFKDIVEMSNYIFEKQYIYDYQVKFLRL